MFFPARSSTPLLNLSIISFFPYLLYSWNPGEEESVPLPFLNQTKKQEVALLPLLARSCRKMRKEKPPLDPQESKRTWSALSIRLPLSAPYFLLCSWSYTGIWMKIPPPVPNSCCSPEGCDSPSLFKNCIPQLVIQLLRALVPGLNTVEPRMKLSSLW